MRLGEVVVVEGKPYEAVLGPDDGACGECPFLYRPCSSLVGECWDGDDPEINMIFKALPLEGPDLGRHNAPGNHMSRLDYWKECLAIAAEECGLSLSDEHLTELAEGAMGGHEHYGMAFYSPPSSDRVASIEREWKAKYDALQKEFDRYRSGAEKAVRTALKQRSDTHVSITGDGEVFRHCGRTEQIL